LIDSIRAENNAAVDGNTLDEPAVSARYKNEISGKNRSSRSQSGIGVYTRTIYLDPFVNDLGSDAHRYPGQVDIIFICGMHNSAVKPGEKLAAASYVVNGNELLWL
jgi:hypothetical protein